MAKFFPLTVTNEVNFLDLSDGARLTYFDIYSVTNDYGIFENSRKYSYLNLKEEYINELINAGYLLKLFGDNSVFAITHWNVENGKLRYRRGNSYNDFIGLRSNGKYYLKNTPSQSTSREKILSENRVNFIFSDSNEDYKTDFD